MPNVGTTIFTKTILLD